jgi:hypothetical protein
MSLVPVYAKCSDGLWYKRPVWHGEYLEDGTFPWFVCLDDDDPPELVVQRDREKPNIPWLKTASLKPYSDALRIFDRKYAFREANAWWALITESPPPPNKYDWLSPAKPKGECVLYEWE